MAFTFRNGEHHRNPSGCHNKVKWILSQCKWDVKDLEFFVDEFFSYYQIGILSHNQPMCSDMPY